MSKILASFFVLNAFLGFSAIASPGESLLISKLSPQFRNEAKVPSAPLVEAVNASVKQDRSLAPDVTAAAVQRAEDCPAVEAVVRAALRQLAPTQTAFEVFNITRAAMGASSHRLTTNAEGDRAIAGNCNEDILTTAAAEYPEFAGMLNNAVSGKSLAGKAPAEPGTGQSEPGIGFSDGPLLLPQVVILPSAGVGLVNPVTPTF